MTKSEKYEPHHTIFCDSPMHTLNDSLIFRLYDSSKYKIMAKSENITSTLRGVKQYLIL